MTTLPSTTSTPAAAKHLLLTVTTRETVIGSVEVPLFKLVLPLGDLGAVDEVAAILAANSTAHINADGTINFSDDVKAKLPIHIVGIKITMAVTVPIQAQLTIVN